MKSLRIKTVNQNYKTFSMANNYMKNLRSKSFINDVCKKKVTYISFTFLPIFLYILIGIKKSLLEEYCIHVTGFQKVKNRTRYLFRFYVY